MKLLIRRSTLTCGCLGVAAALALGPVAARRRAPARATVVIDARRVEGPISPLLYGQFAEFMFEGVKGGLHAELVRNRGFEEPPNAIGLSRHWERYPDDRNDDYGLAFGWDDQVSYPPGGAPPKARPGTRCGSTPARAWSRGTGFIRAGFRYAEGRSTAATCGSKPETTAGA